MIVSGTRLMLNLYEAHYKRTTFGEFEDMPTLRFSTTKPHLHAWLDTSLLTEAIPLESDATTEEHTKEDSPGAPVLGTAGA